MSGKRLVLRVLGVLLLWAAAACARQTPTAWPTATPALAVFRSEQYHVTVDLPPGWAAAEGPQLLAKPFNGWVAFNSWGQPGFWATWIETQSATTTSYRYDREGVLLQMPGDGAYVVLIQVEGRGGGLAEAYGPEYERQDLGGLSLDTADEFSKWGRSLRLESIAARMHRQRSWRNWMPCWRAGALTRCLPATRVGRSPRRAGCCRRRSIHAPFRCATGGGPGTRASSGAYKPRRWARRCRSPSPIDGMRRPRADCPTTARRTGAAGGGSRPGPAARSYCWIKAVRNRLRRFRRAIDGVPPCNG